MKLTTDAPTEPTMHRQQDTSTAGPPRRNSVHEPTPGSGRIATSGLCILLAAALAVPTALEFFTVATKGSILVLLETPEDTIIPTAYHGALEPVGHALMLYAYVAAPVWTRIAIGVVALLHLITLAWASLQSIRLCQASTGSTIDDPWSTTVREARRLRWAVVCSAGTLFVYSWLLPSALTSDEIRQATGSSLTIIPWQLAIAVWTIAVVGCRLLSFITGALAQLHCHSLELDEQNAELRQATEGLV